MRVPRALMTCSGLLCSLNGTVTYVLQLGFEIEYLQYLQAMKQSTS